MPNKEVRLNIRLTADQHKQLADEAATQGRTIAEVVRRALGLKRPPPRKPAEERQ